MRHLDIEGVDAIHEAGFVQPADPIFDSEIDLLPGMAWFDTVELRLKIRNPENNGWIVPGAA